MIAVYVKNIFMCVRIAAHVSNGLKAIGSDDDLLQLDDDHQNVA